MQEWWGDLTVQQKSGGALALVTVGLTITLGFIATDGNALPALLAVLAVVGQFASAWLFSKHRTADPGHAKTIVRQLVGLAAKLEESVDDIQTVQDRRDPAASKQELRDALTVLNVRLSELTDKAITTIESWGDFDPRTLKDLAWPPEQPSQSQAGSGTDETSGGQAA